MRFGACKSTFQSADRKILVANDTSMSERHPSSDSQPSPAQPVTNSGYSLQNPKKENIDLRARNSIPRRTASRSPRRSKYEIHQKRNGNLLRACLEVWFKTGERKNKPYHTGSRSASTRPLERRELLRRQGSHPTKDTRTLSNARA